MMWKPHMRQREKPKPTERIKYRLKVVTGEQARSSKNSVLKDELHSTRQWRYHIGPEAKAFLV